MSWEMVTIKSISKQIRGVSYTPKDVSNVPLEGHVRLLRANNITESGIDLSDTVFVNQRCVSETQKLKVGDVLIAASSGSIKIVGKAILIENEINSSFGAFCKVIRPIENVNYRYLSYYFRSSDYRQKISHLAAGANINNLRNEDLDNLEIPLPPLPIQQRIAEILDAADALRRKDEELLRKYDELAQAIFIDMFGDPVKNEKGWEVKTIEQIAKKEKHSIKRGPFGGALKKEIFVEDGYLVYEQYHALNNDFTFKRYFISEEKYKELEAFKVFPNDIIISCSGVYLGKLAIVPENSIPGIINQALLKISLDESKYSKEFFIKVFTQKNFKDKYFASERGAAIPNFPPMSAFKEFKFIAPPMELQREYIDVTKNLNSQLSLQQNQSEKLFQSLLQQAFKGELVK